MWHSVVSDLETSHLSVTRGLIYRDWSGIHTNTSWNKRAAEVVSVMLVRDPERFLDQSEYWLWCFDGLLNYEKN